MARATASAIALTATIVLCLPSLALAGSPSTLSNYTLLRWSGNPDVNVKARFGTGAQVVDGHVCVDVLGMRGKSEIGSGSPTSDAIALRVNRTAMRFAKTVTIANDVITGGGQIRGEKNVVYGGMIDKSGSSSKLTDCRGAAADATAKHTEFTNPAIVGVNGGTIDGGGQQTINATAPGCNIIDINEISLRKGAELNVVGGALTQSVIIRVATKMHLGRFVKIVLQGLTPEQVLFIVEGPFTSRRGVELRGTILGNHPIWIGRLATVEGQLLSSRKIVMRRFSSATLKPFVDWFGTCGQPTATPSRTTTNSPVPTSTPSATNTAAPPTDTPTPGPSATDTPTSAPTDTPSSTPTDTATSSPTETTTSSPTETATSIPTDTATSAPTDTATPAPSATNTSVPTASPTATASRTQTPTRTRTPAHQATSTATPSV